MSPEDLFDQAASLQENAYVPYSNFPVAAVIKTAKGTIFTGVNVDNSSYPETACAEANAIGAMITTGERDIAEVLVLGGHKAYKVICTPCGGCRQRLAEFCGPDTVVHLCDADGLKESIPFSSLLPRAFGPRNLEG